MPFVLRRFGGAVVLGVAFSGCATYAPRPLELDAARVELFGRAAGDPSVVAFAARLAASGAAPSRYDPSDGLDAAEAEVVALFFNPGLRRARAVARIAAVGSAEAGRWEDPTLAVDGERIVESISEPWVVGGTVGLTLPLSGRLDAERGLASAESRAAAADVLLAEWRARVEVRRLVAGAAADGLRAEVLAAHETRVVAALAVTERLDAAGEIPRFEARLFALERAAASAEAASARARRAAARVALLAACGLAPDAPQEFAVGLAAPAPEGDAARRRREAEARSPVLAAARAAYDVAEEALRLETRRQYPDLAAALGFGVDEGVSRVLFGAGLPLALWNGNRRGVAAADARRAAARAAAVEALESLHYGLVAAEARREAAAALRGSFASQVAPLVDAQMADVEAAARLGRFDPLVLLETLVRLRDAQLRLVDARLEEVLAGVALDEIVGPPAVAVPAAEEPPR